MKRFHILLLAWIIAFWCFASAQEADTYTCTEILSGIGISDFDDLDSLWEGYANSVFMPDLSFFQYANVCRNSLTEMEIKLYDILKDEINKISNGVSASSIIEISTESIGTKNLWTNEDFNSPVYDSSSNSFDFDLIRSSIKEKYSDILDVENVIRALMFDDPYGFYWLDKFEYYSFTQLWHLGFSISLSGSSFTLDLNDYLIFTFPVDEMYQGNSKNSLNTQKTGSVLASMNTAQALITGAEDMTDINKLTYYMQQIRNLSEYNYPAAEGNYSSSDAWQLVTVFDGDPETKVVCEGFSKAFLYLCDLSEFTGDICVYCVQGSMDGGAHMWNIVSSAGLNYLVDVTNCATSGERVNTLFMSTPVSGSVNNGYYMSRCISGYVPQTFLYTYDAETIRYYTTSELTLATIPYTEGPIELDNYTCLNIPDSVLYIEREAFAGCAAEVIYIPSSCIFIGEKAFADCSNLLYLVLPENSNLAVDSSVFGDKDVTILYK